MGLTAAGSSSQDLPWVVTALDHLGAQSHTKNHKECVGAQNKDPYGKSSQLQDFEQPAS